MKKITRKKSIDIIVELILALLVMIFIILPFISVFKESFIIDGRLDLKYYKEILNNKKLLINSLSLGIITSLLSAIATTSISIYAYLSKAKVKKLINIILAITLISPPFVTSLSYITLFGRRGLITHHILHLSINPYNMWGVIFMQTLSFLSLNCMILLGFLNTMDKNLIKSARSLGANTNSIIVDIILPQLKNGIITVVMLSFFKSMSDFATPSIIGGKFNVLALESYFEVIANGNLSKASSLNVLLLVPILLIFLFLNKFNEKKSISSSIRNEFEVNVLRKGVIFSGLKLISIILLALLIALYISITISAFTKMKSGHLALSLENFITVKNYINDATLRSIVYSLISAFLGTTIGLLIGYYVIIKNSKWMKVIDISANLPYILPGTFFGLGYLLYFKKPPFMITGTSIIVVLNVLFKQLPFSTRVGNTAMKSVDTAILNSIRDLGGSSYNEIKDGIIPNIKPSIRISLINSFTTTMTTVGSIIFLVYPGKKLLTLLMFDVINSGKYNEGSVIALLIMLICLLFSFLTSREFRQK